MAEKKKDAEETCPGCGKAFVEQDWPFATPIGDWLVVDGKKFHGTACLSSYRDKTKETPNG